MRNPIKLALVAAALAAPASLPSLAHATDTTELKAKLQASMQRSVERRLVDGALLSLDFETGETTQLYPVEAHPMILAMGDHFVLCSDLKALDGTSKTVDYYMAKNGNRYSIFRTEIDNRAPLKALMKAGKAHHLE